MTRLGAVLAVLAVFAVAPLAHTKAATLPGASNGLRVSPVRTDVTIQPGQSQTVLVTISNVTGGAASFQAIINDFIASADGGRGRDVISKSIDRADRSIVERRDEECAREVGRVVFDKVDVWQLLFFDAQRSRERCLYVVDLGQVLRTVDDV